MNTKTKHILIVGGAVLASLLFVGSYIHTNQTPNSGYPSAPSEPPPLVITYDDNGFNPASARLYGPTRVVFQNSSSQPFWPMPKNVSQSSPCEESAQVGACTSIPVGNSWSVKFNALGDWDYYDKLKPSKGVSITIYPIAY